MNFEDIERIVGHLPATTREDGKRLYAYIRDSSVRDILEIGTYHGKSTCYMAAALHERGGGRIITLDLDAAERYRPNVRDLGRETGLSDFIEPIFLAKGAHWAMRSMIQEASANGVCEPRFDFVFIDAFHSWEMAGLDFFLADKLLRPGGWMLFDDMRWTFATSPSWAGKTDDMPEEYRAAQHVKDVFALLVRQHPGYTAFRDDGRWGWAQKINSSAT